MSTGPRLRTPQRGDRSESTGKGAYSWTAHPIRPAHELRRIRAQQTPRLQVVRGGDRHYPRRRHQGRSSLPASADPTTGEGPNFVESKAREARHLAEREDRG